MSASASSSMRFPVKAKARQKCMALNRAGAIDSQTSVAHGLKNALRRRAPAKSATQDSGGSNVTRDLVGYGDKPPSGRWPNGARLAVSIVVNYEEGSERSHAMGDPDQE